MVARTVAQSVSQRVWERLSTPGFDGTVGATFLRACMVEHRDRMVSFLVLPEIGDGPLNTVIAARPGVFADVKTGTRARLAGDCLMLGPLEVRLGNPAIWEPRPDWEWLRKSLGSITAALPVLHTSAAAAAPGPNLLRLIASRSHQGQSTSELDPTLAGAAMTGIRELESGWEGQPDQICAGAHHLAGLGSGLTPAGDDFLVGLMLWSWLAHPDPESFGLQTLRAAHPRTTVLSAALLSVAACGECSAPWHRLLSALARDDESRRQRALRELLAFGATSGADALAGFVWMGLQHARPLS